MGVNPFDRLIDLFSAKELRHRVWTVVAVGLGICVATTIGGGIFLRAIHSRSVEGTGRWSPSQPRTVEVQLSPDSVGLLKLSDRIAAECTAPNGMIVKTQVRIVEIDLGTGTVQIEPAEVQPELRVQSRFGVRLILYESPLWRFLLSDEGGEHVPE